MKTREEQIKFMDECQTRIRGYVSSWMPDPFFKGAFHHRREEPVEPAPMGGSESEPARKFG